MHDGKIRRDGIGRLDPDSRRAGTFLFDLIRNEINNCSLINNFSFLFQ